MMKHWRCVKLLLCRHLSDKCLTSEQLAEIQTASTNWWYRVTVMVTSGSLLTDKLILLMFWYLWLIMSHLLDQRLTGELLRAAGEVLGRVGGALCYNRGSCCSGWVHHGGRALRVVLVWPLLGHVGYWGVMGRDFMGKKFSLTSLESELNRSMEEWEKVWLVLEARRIIYWIGLNVKRQLIG